MVGAFLFLLVVVLLWWCIRTGHCKDLKSLDKFFFWRGRSPRGPGAEDNARIEIRNNRDSCSILDSQQTMESQELAVLTGVTVTSPGEAECVLGPTEAKGSQMTTPLVQANGVGADPTDKPAHEADGTDGQRHSCGQSPPSGPGGCPV
ncbi:PREDICTED: tumor necrosis factor receptor superfamily member 10A-like [Propithecus coquereli]|uniref:tumor necrosis factor receptor superfamily member 10A-like n=1 Tax=Propithecus coquereli TaxID=379532 RepID=UPI00063F2258|nr:PREDICTED: tumor necrosis factor receptor superfamily member 10A-like [Propithecus coquereli]